MKFTVSIFIFMLSTMGVASAQTAVAVGAVGGLTAGKAVSSCWRHPILCGAGVAAGALAVRHYNRQVDLALARQQSSAGEPLNPPGYCPDETHSWLTAMVDKLCKKVDEMSRCTPSEGPTELRAKAQLFSQCAKIRAKREDLCYRGGNTGHRMQIQQMWQAHDRCQTLVGLQ